MRLPFRLSGRRRLLALASAGALVVSSGVVVAITATPAHAQTACEVDFQAGEWNDGNGGFTANITINNLGEQVDGWTLAFELPGGASFTNGWSADWNGSSSLTAGDLGWNAVLPTGGSTVFGFNGSGFGGAPSEFTLNGLVCDGTNNGGNESPSATLTSPSSGQEFEEGVAVPLAADASDPDGNVDRVEFLVDGSLVDTDTTAPYEASATGLATGSHTAQAVAFDDNDPEASGESSIVSFDVVGEVDPAIQASQSSLSIVTGSSESVNFSLNTAPGGSVTVTVDSPGFVSVTPSSFSLDDSNFSAGQDVTVSGDAEGSGTITASAPGFGSVDVDVTVSEDVEPQPRVDNPYAGADMYVNQDWSNAAQDSGAGPEVYEQGTGVWLDTVGAIEEGSQGENFTGLEGHLDLAVDQDQANGSTPLVFQVVIYNLPGRDCSALASNGEFGPDELPRYEAEYIDVIADIIDRPEYRNLRISAIIEIDSLPNLVTNVNGAGSTELCGTMQQNGGYVNGVGYALSELGAIPNVYNYVDAAHHGWIGWSDNFTPTANIICDAANANGAEPDDVHGLITNTANYSALEEPFIEINSQTQNTDWIDFNQYNSELPFAQDFGQEFVSVCGGADPNLGMLIDTSRNGWGGAARPDGPSNAGDVNQMVEESRIDQRIHKGNWCNQAGAGLGERPTANPAPGIDAYVWIKPPGESDGSSELIPVGPENPDGKGFDEMCDPDYGGNDRNGNNPSGALPNAPVSGNWFEAQFDELRQNAFPALP